MEFGDGLRRLATRRRRARRTAGSERPSRRSRTPVQGAGRGGARCVRLAGPTCHHTDQPSSCRFHRKASMRRSSPSCFSRPARSSSAEPAHRGRLQWPSVARPSVRPSSFSFQRRAIRVAASASASAALTAARRTRRRRLAVRPKQVGSADLGLAAECWVFSSMVVVPEPAVKALGAFDALSGRSRRRPSC
jgi:hypothetical protein